MLIVHLYQHPNIKTKQERSRSGGAVNEGCPYLSLSRPRFLSDMFLCLYLLLLRNTYNHENVMHIYTKKFTMKVRSGR